MTCKALGANQWAFHAKVLLFAILPYRVHWQSRIAQLLSAAIHNVWSSEQPVCFVLHRKSLHLPWPSNKTDDLLATLIRPGAFHRSSSSTVHLRTAIFGVGHPKLRRQQVNALVLTTYPLQAGPPKMMQQKQHGNTRVAYNVSLSTKTDLQPSKLGIRRSGYL